MILDSSGNATGARTTLDDLFRRAGVRHPDALALIRSAQPRGVHRRRAAPADLCAGRPDDSAQSPRAARARPGHRRGGGAAIAQHGGERAGAARHLARRHDRRAFAAALAPAGRRRRACAASAPRRSSPACASARRRRPRSPCRWRRICLPIRHVCAFGDNLPDGVVALDDVFAPSAGATGVIPRSGDPAAHVAVVTFEVGAERHRAAGARSSAAHRRRHGRASPGRHCAGRTQLSSRLIPVGSFAGMAATLLPWLLGGGTLHLHHAFDADAFAQTCREQNPDARRVARRGARHRSGRLARRCKSRGRVVARARAARRARALAWPRGAGGHRELRRHRAHRARAARPMALPRHLSHRCPGQCRRAPDIETARSPAGTLCLRGAMVPSHAFPPGAAAPLALDAEGFLDTGYPCRLLRPGPRLTVTGPPAGMAAVGAYRFRAGDLDRLAQSLDAGVTLAALAAGADRRRPRRARRRPRGGQAPSWPSRASIR